MGTVQTRSMILERSGQPGRFSIGAFMREKEPPVLPGGREGFSKAKKGELNASPKGH